MIFTKCAHQSCPNEVPLFLCALDMPFNTSAKKHDFSLFWIFFLSFSSPFHCFIPRCLNFAILICAASVKHCIYGVNSFLTKTSFYPFGSTYLGSIDIIVRHFRKTPYGPYGSLLPTDQTFIFYIH